MARDTRKEKMIALKIITKLIVVCPLLTLSIYTAVGGLSFLE
jgi:hypothetical protein